MPKVEVFYRFYKKKKARYAIVIKMERSDTIILGILGIILLRYLLSS